MVHDQPAQNKTILVRYSRCSDSGMEWMLLIVARRNHAAAGFTREAMTMPYEDMTLEQIEELLNAQAKLESLPGVKYLQPEYIDNRERRAAICVYLDARHRTTMDQLPSTLGGLPVVVKLEDVRTSTVLETIRLGQEDRN